jgi:hypothetical protein
LAEKLAIIELEKGIHQVTEENELDDGEPDKALSLNIICNFMYSSVLVKNQRYLAAQKHRDNKFHSTILSVSISIWAPCGPMLPG